MIADGTRFIVLTGFLGSGKTTLLREYLALPEAANSAVIVNEAGAIGLDGAILAEGGQMPVAMLQNGCVCCSLGSDLERTVISLIAARGRANLPPPARIILETSGLAKPGPILRSLSGLAPLRLRLGVTATFDCTRGAAVEGFEEAAAQWAGADMLVLTKRDIASPAQMRQARSAAARVNPTATVIDTGDRRAAALAAFSPQAPSATASRFPRAEAVGPAHPRIRVLLASLGEAVCWDDLAEWLDNLAGVCGERLLRVKGLVRVEGSAEPLLVQSVGTTFSAPRRFAGGDGRSYLVLILRDLDAGDLAGLRPDLPLTFGELGQEGAAA